MSCVHKLRLAKRVPDVWDCRFATCGIFRRFLASGFFYSQTESTPAHTQVTQTVGRLAPHEARFMSEIEKVVKKLRSPKAGTRYEAYELLRVARLKRLKHWRKSCTTRTPLSSRAPHEHSKDTKESRSDQASLPSRNSIVGQTFQLNTSSRSFCRFPSFVFFSAHYYTRSDLSWISQ